MAYDEVSVEIDKSASDAWEIVGDFGGLKRFAPGVEECILDGDVRNLTIMGNKVAEKLVSNDSSNMELKYTIIEGFPLTSHESTMKVESLSPTSCKVTWSVNAEPDDMASFLSTIYKAGLDALKLTLERS